MSFFSTGSDFHYAICNNAIFAISYPVFVISTLQNESFLHFSPQKFAKPHFINVSLHSQTARRPHGLNLTHASGSFNRLLPPLSPKQQRLFRELQFRKKAKISNRACSWVVRSPLQGRSKTVRNVRIRKFAVFSHPILDIYRPKGKRTLTFCITFLRKFTSNHQKTCISQK